MQIFRDRQALHAIPELGLKLPKTAAYVKTALKDLNCTIFSPLSVKVISINLLSFWSMCFSR